MSGAHSVRVTDEVKRNTEPTRRAQWQGSRHVEDASWAIYFYRRNGFTGLEQKDRLLRSTGEKFCARVVRPALTS